MCVVEWARRVGGRISVPFSGLAMRKEKERVVSGLWQEFRVRLVWRDKSGCHHVWLAYLPFAILRMKAGADGRKVGCNFSQTNFIYSITELIIYWCTFRWGIYAPSDAIDELQCMFQSGVCTGDITNSKGWITTATWWCLTLDIDRGSTNRHSLVF